MRPAIFVSKYLDSKYGAPSYAGDQFAASKINDFTWPTPVLRQRAAALSAALEDYQATGGVAGFELADPSISGPSLALLHACGQTAPANGKTLVGHQRRSGNQPPQRKASRVEPPFKVTDKSGAVIGEFYSIEDTKRSLPQVRHWQQDGTRKLGWNGWNENPAPFGSAPDYMITFVDPPRTAEREEPHEQVHSGSPVAPGPHSAR